MVEIVAKATQNKGEFERIVEDVFEAFKGFEQVEAAVGDGDSVGKVVVRVSVAGVVVLAFSCEVVEGFEVDAEFW